MNYWILTTEFPPIHGGGISTYVWHTAKMFAEAGHQVKVLINNSDTDATIKEYPFDNLELIRFSPNQVKKGEILGYEARLSLEFSNAVEIEMKKSGVPDILEVQDYSGIGYYTMQKKHLLYSLFKDLKIIITLHAPGFLYLEYNQVPLYNFPVYWTGQFEKASIKMADLIISPSKYLIDEVNNYLNIKNEETVQIFNPYFSEKLTDRIYDYNFGDLVFFGKLTPQKGCLEMFSYFKNMWDNGFKHTLTVIGGGEHFFYPIQEDMISFVKKKYSKYIKQGLVRFTGNLSPENLENRLQKAHVVITPSIVDNLPYAVIEAMGMGKIVLSSTNGGHTEIMEHEKSGFIFNHSIEKDFENILLKILEKDKSSLKLIAINAKKNVERCTNYKDVLTQKIIHLKQLVTIKQNKTKFPFIEEIPALLESSVSLQKVEPNKLSIVIPYYNMGSFVEDTLKSLTRIDYPYFEILLINDGSSEPESISKIKELEIKYEISVFHKQNEGLSKTRNFGAAKSNGEFLAFLDADDTVSPEYYSRAIEVLKNYNNVSFVGCWAQYFGENKDIWPTFNPEPPYLLCHNMINSSALIYKKEDFLRFGKNDPNLIYGMEDYDSVINMTKNGARGVAFPELWWQYRIRNDSMAQSFTKNKELYLYRLISKKHKEFFKEYGEELVNLLNHNGSGIYFNNPTWPIEDDKTRLISIKNQKIVTLIKKNKALRFFAKKIYNKLNN